MRQTPRAAERNIRMDPCREQYPRRKTIGHGQAHSQDVPKRPWSSLSRHMKYRDSSSLHPWGRIRISSHRKRRPVPAPRRASVCPCRLQTTQLEKGQCLALVPSKHNLARILTGHNSKARQSLASFPPPWTPRERPALLSAEAFPMHPDNVSSTLTICACWPPVDRRLAGSFSVQTSI